MESGGKKEAKAEPEATSEVLSNPARVVPTQEKFIRMPSDCRYTPLKNTHSGFVMLKDKTPGEPEEFVSVDGQGGNAAEVGRLAGAAPAPAQQVEPAGGSEEAPPPEAFVYGESL